MRSVPISTAKNQLSALLLEVRAGATITITDRGVPIARLSPPSPTRGIPAVALDLAQQGLLTLPERAPGVRWLDLERPTLKAGASAVQFLLEERAGGR
jgi:prevent-host-death family protein